MDWGRWWRNRRRMLPPSLRNRGLRLRRRPPLRQKFRLLRSLQVSVGKSKTEDGTVLEGFWGSTCISYIRSPGPFLLWRFGGLRRFNRIIRLDALQTQISALGNRSLLVHRSSQLPTLRLVRDLDRHTPLPLEESRHSSLLWRTARSRRRKYYR